MKKNSILLLLCIVFSSCFARGIKRTVIMRLAPPPKVSYFLDRLYAQGKLTKEAVGNYALWLSQLKAAEFTIIKTSKNKIVAQLPRPNQNYLMKICCTRLNTQRNCSRVFEAQRLREVIKRDNLPLVQVPEKHLYHIPGTQKKVSDGNYVVLSKMLRINRTKTLFNLPIKALQQLWYAMSYAHYFDHGYVVDVAKKIVTLGDNIQIDDAGRAIIINTKDRKEVSSMEAYCDIASIKKMLSLNGNMSAPQDALFAQVLIEQGKKLHRYDWEVKGKLLLRKVYTICAGLFPFVMLKGRMVMPVVMEMVRDCEFMMKSLTARHPMLLEYYRRRVRDNQVAGGDFSLSLRNLVRKQWQTWRTAPGGPFVVEG